uniref:Nonstructural protein 8 n=1 Tax=Alphacoronavirus sp. TaxID=1906673 RepID=A0A8F0ZVP6_9ALPC|nr:nonstructural protein 8 [Alphacoronavirus sp.]
MACLKPIVTFALVAVVSAAPVTYKGSQTFVRPTGTTNASTLVPQHEKLFTIWGKCLASTFSITRGMIVVSGHWVIGPSVPPNAGVAIPITLDAHGEDHVDLFTNSYSKNWAIITYCFSGDHVTSKIKELAILLGGSETKSVC